MDQISGRCAGVARIQRWLSSQDESHSRYRISSRELTQGGWVTDTKDLSDIYEGRVQRDRRVVTRKSRPLAGCYLTELVEPCGALPRKCLFIYLFQPDRMAGAQSHWNMSGDCPNIVKSAPEDVEGMLPVTFHTITVVHLRVPHVSD
jgi:hypothetical protein